MELNVRSRYEDALLAVEVQRNLLAMALVSHYPRLRRVTFYLARRHGTWTARISATTLLGDGKSSRVTVDEQCAYTPQAAFLAAADRLNDILDSRTMTSAA